MQESSGEIFEQKEREPKIYQLEGLNFDLKKKQEAWDNDRPLQLGLAFPSKEQGRCNLDCLYCYTREYRPKEGTRYLDEQDLKRLLEEAKGMGAENLIIPGYGEPFMNPEFWHVLEKAKEMGLYTIIFSNASMITEEVAEKLKDFPVSFMIKLNTLNKEKQDKLVGKKGFSEKQWRGLNALIDAGFNKPNENGNVRLAVHTIICKDTIEDVPEVVKWAVEHNVFPFVEELFPEGNALRHQDILGTPEEIRKIYGPQVRKKIKEMYPQRKQEIFGEGTCDFETYSVIVEQFSSRGTECFTRRDKDLGNYGQGDSLKDIWDKNKDSRKHRIEKIDPRSSYFQPECGDCAECPGRRAALERLAQGLDII